MTTKPVAGGEKASQVGKYVRELLVKGDTSSCAQRTRKFLYMFGVVRNFLRGFYRAAFAELRTALELTMIGACGNLYATDKDYSAWKVGTGDLNFRRYRKRLLGSLRKKQGKWMFEEMGFSQ